MGERAPSTPSQVTRHGSLHPRRPGSSWCPPTWSRRRRRPVPVPAARQAPFEPAQEHGSPVRRGEHRRARRRSSRVVRRPSPGCRDVRRVDIDLKVGVNPEVDIDLKVDIVLKVGVNPEVGVDLTVCPAPPAVAPGAACRLVGTRRPHLRRCVRQCRPGSPAPPARDRPRWARAHSQAGPPNGSAAAAPLGGGPYEAAAESPVCRRRRSPGRQ